MSALKNHARMLKHTLAQWSKYKRDASHDHGVSEPRQLLELLRLRLGQGKLRADDYYKLRLYRSDMGFTEKQQYASNAALPRPVFARWAAVADDKLLTYSILGDAGFPVPKILALCHAFRPYRDRPTLKSTAEIAAWLRGPAPYPFIAKPIGGIYSEGVYLLEGYDANADKVMLAGEAPMPAETFAARLLSLEGGYLFQELLRPQIAIREAISDKLCTLRVIVLLEERAPRLFMAIWKINAGGTAADNYWREGNMLAKLDQESGAILHCMTGLGPKLRIVETHPRTGATLAGFQVPLYREAVDLALQASKCFPGLPMQAWDIALTDSGPLPLEVNVAGSVFIPQLVSQRGLWSGEFGDYFRRMCRPKARPSALSHAE